jgi:hypothetical protein
MMQNRSLPVLRAILVTIVTIGVVLGFVAGFVDFGRPGNAAIVGLAVGIGSALTWAWGSLGTSMSNWWNVVAAIFAATSLGYLAPVTGLCSSSALAGGSLGATAARNVCAIRALYLTTP